MTRMMLRTLALILGLLPAVLGGQALAQACGYDDMLNRLGQRESGGVYTRTNTFNFLGKYQFGEDALIDIGMYQRDGTRGNRQDFRGSWTGKYGVNSVQDFLNNPQAQERAIRDYMRVQWGYARSFGLTRYLGQTMNGVVITESAILMGMHLKGIGNMRSYLASGGTRNPADGYGTRISEYVRLGSGYATPFGATGVSGNCAADFGSGGEGNATGGEEFESGRSGEEYRPPGSRRPSGPDTSIPSDNFDPRGGGLGAAGGGGQDCDPSIENAIIQAQGQGLERTNNDITGSILEPPVNTVLNCLNNILSAGLRVSWEFKVPNLQDILNAAARRLCQEMNKLFDKATQDVFGQFQKSVPFGRVNVGLSQNQSDLFRYGGTVRSPLDGSVIDQRSGRIGEAPQIQIDPRR